MAVSKIIHSFTALNLMYRDLYGKMKKNNHFQTLLVRR